MALVPLDGIDGLRILIMFIRAIAVIDEEGALQFPRSEAIGFRISFWFLKNFISNQDIYLTENSKLTNLHSLNLPLYILDRDYELVNDLEQP